MEKAYKGMMGGYAVWKDGDEKHEATHKILTNEEYSNLTDKIKSLERQLREEKKAHENDLNNANEKLLAERQDSQKKIDDAMNKVAAAEEETRHQTELNYALLEMAKNRANADRKLRPKKVHSGYVVVSSDEKPYKYKSESKTVSTTLWKTVIQTPYNMDFSESQVRDLIKRDLFEVDEAGNWLIEKIGINGAWKGKVEKLQKDEKYSKLNCKIDERIRANYKAGYWEVIYTHSKPLGIVPKDMRAS